MMKSYWPEKHTTPVLKKNQPDDSYKFQPLPSPVGEYPYHLPLKNVLPEVDPDKLVFHMLGDTGSVYNPDFQKLVVAEMVKQYEAQDDTEDKPRFLYHLGDIVYNFGEASQYHRQFFEPFQKYPGPIFAIPGNHDSDVNPYGRTPYKSLEPFSAVFCTAESQTVAFSNNAVRKSMVQPNVYWTLVTPLANIIGMYGNVTKFGLITPEQRSWLIDELKAADRQRPDKAIILCIHHAPYSADVNHGSSLYMIDFLDKAFEEAGVRPDVVFSGHVHNYQRFSKTYPDGRNVPFVVAGGGGYDELHPVATTFDPRFTSENALFDGVTLENHCDTKHGFLKVTVEKKERGIEIRAGFYTLPHEKRSRPGINADLADHFSLMV
ncbi:metallophosphoesterase family protein [Dyadobacter aurulentus]|uniref:metallophosphoesterase family protein n=1 Tax=Dyadobacter sp. UC 10 TaxID=2605428 RepID=UPI001CEC0614|nr:metallophosphoesterase [Dyadobacter sp. UC 10]